MNRIKFEGKDAWFIAPNNKYGLSRFPLGKITEDDFSFFVKVKVDWDKMSPNDRTNEGGIIVKNGLHLGITAFHPEPNQYYFKATVWSNVNVYGNDEVWNKDILVKIDRDEVDDSTEHDLGFSFSKKTNEFSVFHNGNWFTEKYDGSLVDYSTSWLWLGASNALESCPIEFRQYLFGEISLAGIFSKALDETEFMEVRDNFRNIPKRLKPVALFNFESITPYKVLDISKMGNNLEKFDITWMRVLDDE